MILSLRGHACNLFAILFIAACGSGAPREGALAGGAATSATTCGSQCGLSCQAGCYPTSVSNDFSCGSPNGNARVQCAKIQGSPISTCESGCPTGYYVASTNTTSGVCNIGFGGIQTQCRTVTGTQLKTCEEKCPDGYFPSGVQSNVQACAARYRGIQTTCTQVSGTALDTCDDSCPGGYYPQSTVFDSFGCGLPYSNTRTHCAKIGGAQFLSCEACPAGYYPSRTQKPVASCGGRYGEIQTSCVQATATTLQTCGTVCPAGYHVQGSRMNVAECKWAYAGTQTTCSKDASSTCEENCPTGYYVTGTVTDLGCIGNVRVQCAPVQGTSFPTCQQDCPSGYTATSLQENIPQCGGSFFRIQITCTRVTGPSITTCESKCPDGYHITSESGSAPQCGNRYKDIQTTCAATGGTPFDTCGEACPDGWYPTALRNNAFNCAVRSSRHEVSCSKIGGTTFTTCGPNCPPGWFPGRTIPSSRCGQVYLDEETECFKTNPQAPVITRQPQPVSIVAGQLTLLTVGATGQGPLSYQWYTGASGDKSSPIQKATSSQVNVSPAATTSYWVLVSNSHGEVASNTATVTVTPACVAPGISAQPQSAHIVAGQAATLQVTATGTSPAYQWYEGTSGNTSRPVSGATSPALIVFAQQTTSYWVRVTNSCGSANSGTATVTVDPPCVAPAIVSQPQAASITEGQVATLTVGATGTSLTYQWYQGESGGLSSPVAGATTSTLLATPPGTTSYWVRVTNACGHADSASAQVTVTAACVSPSITAQPQGAAIIEGGTAQLSVSAAGSALSYQWYSGGSGDTSSPLPGETAAAVNVAPSSTSTYWVRVSNACGRADSEPATVTVTAACVPPAIETQPASVTVILGDLTTLTVGARGTALSYQWYLGPSGDTSTPMATGPSLTVAPTQTESVWVRVFNSCGSVNSATATLTVTPFCIAPAIVTQPSDATINAGQAATLSAAASGTSISWQWYAGPRGDTSAALAGATSASVTVSPAATTAYWARAANTCGSADTNAATVNVVVPCVPPAFTRQPQSTSIDAGQSATLSADVTGSAGMTFQWYQGGSGDTSSPVFGATGPVVVVAPPSTAAYWLRAANACGQADSDAATVVVAPPQGCGADGTACGGDGNHTCQGGVCVCSNCASGACCGATGNPWCDGQEFFDQNTGYAGTCASSLSSCSAASSFDGSNALYHDGDIVGCVKFDGAYGWYPRRPSPRCHEVAQTCDFVCSANYQSGQGFQCDANGNWSQDPPLAECFGGALPDGWACQ